MVTNKLRYWYLVLPVLFSSLSGRKKYITSEKNEVIEKTDFFRVKKKHFN